MLLVLNVVFCMGRFSASTFVRLKHLSCYIAVLVRALCPPICSLRVRVVTPSSLRAIRSVWRFPVVLSDIV